ncbi:MAG: GNAT family N-acetyltransferase, partial [Trebonia sp.]
YLFAHTPVNRVEAWTEDGNIAEQRSLEKAGFTQEGVRRGAAWRDGAWRDGVLYGILREEATA